jgi:xanthosine utilization system XapX-like protein
MRRKPDGEILPDAVTARVLTRASELDALRRTGATVAELRAAATEAGISAEAFDAALAELEEAESTQVSTAVVGTRRRSKLKVVMALVALLALGVAFALARMVEPRGAPAAVTTVEQTLPLGCLTPTRLSELVRPVVDPQTTTISFSDGSPSVFTIRATPAEIEKVKAVLDNPATCPR